MAGAGSYRDMVDIQQDSRNDGDQQPNYTGAPLFSDVPCSIEATGGNETFRGRQLEAHTDFVVEMHLLPGIKPDMRLSVTGGNHAGVFLNISHVLPTKFSGRAPRVELYCKTVPVTRE